MSETDATFATQTMVVAPTLSGRIGVPALVIGATISSVGNGMTMLAIPWFVLITTGSAARAGIVGAASAVALILSGLLGGPAVDRLGFKPSSVIADFASMITVALIPTLYWLDVLEFWMLLVLVFLGAVFDSPGHSAKIAMIPRLAERSRMPLERANAAMQFGTNGSMTLLGPLAAGALIGAIGEANVLYIDALTFLGAIVLVGLFVPLPWRPAAQSPGVDNELQQRASYFEDMREGLSFVSNDRFLTAAIPIAVLMSFLFAPNLSVYLPVFALERFGNAGSLGLLLGASGAGILLGTILFGVFGQRFVATTSLPTH